VFSCQLACFQARNNQIGDGKVFVSAIENAIRIRTRECGEHAV
jgi:nitrogen regulatory protein PII